MAQIKRSSAIIIPLAALSVVIPGLAFGTIGVGVGAGKIQIDEPLRAGGIYDLPQLPVINTGDEPSNYDASVEYLQDIPQMRPDKNWFSFDPKEFFLEPGGVQNVKVTLTLPTKVTPGEYFAYLEGHPFKKSVSGQTSIGVAAAVKLYFTVAPANIFQGMYYRLISLSAHYYPWDAIILLIVIVTLAIRFVSARFKFEIARK